MATAVLVIAVAMLGLLFFPWHGSLTLRDYNSGSVIARYSIEPGESFSVEFIHSVNKTPVRDIYVVCDDGLLRSTACVYYGFGAGVQTQLNDGESLRYEDGAMIIENINKYYSELLYGVSRSSTHVLRIGDEEIFLPALLERDTIVIIEFSRSFF